MSSKGRYETFQRVSQDEYDEDLMIHPIARASCMSKILLTWVLPLMRVGNTKQLDEEDIWPLQHPHQSEVVSFQFISGFERLKSIPRAFFQLFGRRFIVTGICYFISVLCTLFGPLVLNHVVSSLTTEGAFSSTNVTIWVLGLFATQCLQALTDTYANFDAELIAIQFTAALKTMIYQKSMKLNAVSRKEQSTGDISNLYTSDCDAILSAAYFVHQSWLVPTQILVVSYMLYRVLGLASLAGLSVIVLIFYLNRVISNAMFRDNIAYMKLRDERMKRVTETFKSISIVKFNAWEEKFLERIDVARAAEVANVWKYMLTSTASISLLWGMPVFISIISFGVYSLVLGQTLTPAIVFTSLSLFQLIQGPLRFIATIISMLIRARVSLARVSKFLDLPEIDQDAVIGIRHPSSDRYITKNVIISIENGSFAWGENKESTMILKDINLHVKVGNFVVIHGIVGCGKSSLCSALLGEMIKRQGTVYVGGSVAYCSQQPWIQNLTVRENILFGLPYDRKKYDHVIEACALTEDLKTLSAGDNTEIGERGINLSGGQKARIALARACYSDASVYILDAPLSAVDAIVQNEIFNKCFLGLLRNKTIILVTHNPEIITSKHVTQAFSINSKGKLIETHEVIPEKQINYDPAVTPLAATPYAKKTFEEVEEDDITKEGMLEFERENAIIDEEIGVPLVSPCQKMRLSCTNADDKGEKDFETTRKSLTSKTDGKLIAEEGRHEGRVDKKVFIAYFSALGGVPTIALVLGSQLLWQVLQIWSDFWLSDWTGSKAASDETGYRLGVYAAIGVASAMMVPVRTMTVSYYGLRAGKSMFNEMTKALMHAPMRFFDSNPIGRILTRYSADVTGVDVRLPMIFGSFCANLFSIGCAILTAAGIIRWKGLFLLPVCVVYAQVGKFYLQPARELERLTKTTQSPLLSHLSESVDGGPVIRAFGSSQVSRFTNINHDKLDRGNKIWYAQFSVSQWFSLQIQLLGGVLVLVITTSLVLLRDELSAAVIGLAFSYALRISQNMEKIIQIWSRFETTMVSPERLQEYIDIPQEAPHHISTMDPSKNAKWPDIGEISFKNVCFRYKENGQLVLKDLNFKIAGKEKIGIVGRTGAGKSSLTMALFRINELASGQIFIDGVDISKIGLKTLRGKLSIIPQNPVLFKGTLRYYLDPFDEFTDDQLWRSLREVGLHDRISSESGKLESMVEENGENFSVGERQMLCMTRALLRNTRIVIFDEATAAIDHETDQMLQCVIRRAFAHSTVLTIAHRLDTILDSNRILLLDHGKMVEFESPQSLVAKGKGHFFDLMKEGGYLEKFHQQSQ